MSALSVRSDDRAVVAGRRMIPADFPTVAKGIKETMATDGA